MNENTSTTETKWTLTQEVYGPNFALELPGGAYYEMPFVGGGGAIVGHVMSVTGWPTHYYASNNRVGYDTAVCYDLTDHQGSTLLKALREFRRTGEYPTIEF